VPVWHDPTVDWAAFELLVIRSTWDYSYRIGEFVPWLERVSEVAPLLNCPHLIRWNLDKSYLLELAGHQVPVIATEVAEAPSEVWPALSRVESDFVVVKPLVSAGARDTGLYRRDDPEAGELALRIVVGGRKAAIQPAVASVASKGEKALIFIDGAFSHAVSKGPILSLGGGLRGGSYRETISACQPTTDELALAESASAVVAAIAGSWACGCRGVTPLLYSRYDVVEAEQAPLLLEAELFEPSLFLSSASGSARRLAEAVAARLAGGSG